PVQRVARPANRARELPLPHLRLATVAAHESKAKRSCRSPKTREAGTTPTDSSTTRRPHAGAYPEPAHGRVTSDCWVYRSQATPRPPKNPGGPSRTRSRRPREYRGPTHP